MKRLNYTLIFLIYFIPVKSQDSLLLRSVHLYSIPILNHYTISVDKETLMSIAIENDIGHDTTCFNRHYVHDSLVDRSLLVSLDSVLRGNNIISYYLGGQKLKQKKIRRTTTDLRVGFLLNYSDSIYIFIGIRGFDTSKWMRVQDGVYAFDDNLYRTLYSYLKRSCELRNELKIRQ